MLGLLLCIARGVTWPLKRALIILVLLLLARYLDIEEEEEAFMRIDPARREPRSWHRTHLTFQTCGGCLGKTRFNQEELHRLLRCLRLPAEIVINRCTLTSEECLLIFLHKFALDLSFPAMAMDHYGGSDTLISDAYHYMLNHVYRTFAIQLSSSIMLGKWAIWQQHLFILRLPSQHRLAVDGGISRGLL